MPTSQPLGPNFRVVEHVAQARVPRQCSERFFQESGNELPVIIYPEIRTMTADKKTRNRTRYPKASLIGSPNEGTGLISFVRPYPIPIIRDHLDGPNPFSGMQASEVYGRVWKPAEFVTLAGESYLKTVPAITSPEAIEKVLRNEWLTVSLGCITQAVLCTICGTDLVQSGCEHDKGAFYEVDDEQVECLWDIGPIQAREISFVLTPSDDQAGVINVNLQESAGGEPVLPEGSVSRILLGTQKGIYDLSNGNRIQDIDCTRFLESASPATQVFSFRGFQPGAPKKETHMKKLDAGATAKEAEITEQNVAESFKGSGRYLLSGYSHDHEVKLNGKGDGVSTPGGRDNHTHEVVGGVVRVAGGVDNDDDGYDYSYGNYPHTHYLDAAHAADESAQENAMPQFAAKLVDAGHGVDTNLYALPETQEALQATLTVLEAMPHTPEEKASILAVLAKHAEGVEGADVAALFPEVKAAEAVAAVEIALSATNYALLYSALQSGAAVLPTPQAPAAADAKDANGDPAEKQAETAAAETPVTETEKPSDKPAETPAAGTPGAAPTAEQQELAALKTKNADLLRQVEALKPLATGDATAASKLQAELETTREERDQAQAEAAALIMGILHKPQARGKSTQELAESLVSAGRESLRYRLEFLREELAAGAGGTSTPPPVIADPTQGGSVQEDAAGDKPGDASLEEQEAGDNIPPQNPGNLANLADLMAFELPVAEGEQDAIGLLFPDFA